MSIPTAAADHIDFKSSNFAPFTEIEMKLTLTFLIIAFLAMSAVVFGERNTFFIEVPNQLF